MFAFLPVPEGATPATAATPKQISWTDGPNIGRRRGQIKTITRGIIASPAPKQGMFDDETQAIMARNPQLMGKA
jgi:hypothetical protein